MADYPIGYMVKRVRLLIRHRFDEVLTQHGMTAASYEALFHLASRGPISSAELARLAGVTAQTMHRQVQHLVDVELIRPLDTPGRAIGLELTNAGRRVFEAAKHQVMAIEQRMLAGLSVHEREELGRLLRHCEARLGEDAST